MWSIYKTLLKVAVAVNVQYRASGFIWTIGMVLDPVIFLVVWSTVAKSKGGEVGDFSVSQLAAYYIALMLVNHVTFTWIMHEFQYRIQEGQFSFLLLRPIHPIHSDIADNLGYKLVMSVVMIPAAVLLAVLFRPSFDAPLWAILAFVPTLVGAFALRFVTGWVLALAAFWTTRTEAINQIYFALLMLLSGRVAPVELLPDVLQTASRVLPFYWVAAFPVEVLLGRVEPGAVLVGLLVQVLWTGASVAFLGLAWRFAVSRYSAVGG